MQRAACVAVPARARVRRGDEHEAGREDHHLLAADDRHVAVLERLAQGLEARARELRELVEEQHAVMRERRLAGLGRAGAADEPRGRDGVVRRAERALGDEPAGAAQAGDRLDARDLDRLVRVQRREDRRAAGGRSSSCPCPAGPAGTGCARPPRRPRGRAPARCGRGRRRGRGPPPRRRRASARDARRLGVAAHGRHELDQRLDPDDLDVRDQRRLAAHARAAGSGA